MFQSVPDRDLVLIPAWCKRNTIENIMSSNRNIESIQLLLDMMFSIESIQLLLDTIENIMSSNSWIDSIFLTDDFLLDGSSRNQSL